MQEESIETKSVWLENERERRAAYGGSARADVAVVGGGAAGVAAAYFAAQAGLETVLFEQGALGSGATGHGAGLVLAGGGLPYASLIRRVGAGVARRLWEATLRNQMLLEALLGADAPACGYASEGSLTCAFSPSEALVLRKSERALNRHGFAAELAGPAAMPWNLKEAGALLGLFIPADGALDPVALTHAVAGLAEQWGARLYEGSKVVGVRREKSEFVVELASGTLMARSVVIASGAGMQALLPQLTFMRPYVGQLLLTGPVQAEERRPVLAGGGRQLLRHLPEGVLLAGRFGGQAPDGEESALVSLAQKITGHEVREPRRWSVAQSAAADGLPVIGPATEGLYVLGGLGLSQAFFAAELVGAALCGEEKSFGPFSPRRFQGAPRRS